MAKLFSINSVFCIPTCYVNRGLQFKLASNMAWCDDTEMGCIDNISVISHFFVQLKSKAKQSKAKQSKASHYNETTAGGKRRLQLT